MVKDEIEKIDRYNIKALERLFDILDLMAKTDEPLSVQLLVQKLGFNSNMAFRMLTTMQKSGYLHKDEKTGTFNVTLKFLPLSQKALMSMEIRRVVMPFMEMLRSKYPKANLNLAVLHDGDVVVIDRIDSVSLPRTYFAPGKSIPFHATSLGKSLTCELPETELDALIAKKGMKAYTPTTITDPTVLKEELAKVQREHVSRDRAEFILNDNCNAVPIRDSTSSIIAAISISAFENYMTVAELEETIPFLMETGRNISYYMGYNT